MTIEFLENIVDAFDGMTYIKKHWKLISITERTDECFASGQPIVDIVIYKNGIFQSIAFMNDTLTIPVAIKGTTELTESSFFIEDLERVLDGYLRQFQDNLPLSRVSFGNSVAFFHRRDKIILYSKIKDICI